MIGDAFWTIFSQTHLVTLLVMDITLSCILNVHVYFSAKMAIKNAMLGSRK
jgi:hypothetical protein